MPSSRDQRGDLGVVARRSRRRAPPSRRGSRRGGARRRARSRSRSAARIEVGLALYASLTTSPPPGQLVHLAAPAARAGSRAAPSCAPVERQPERVVGLEGAEHVPRQVALVERQLELERAAADARSARRVPAALDGRRVESPDLDVVARQERLELGHAGGHDGDAAGRQRHDRLGVRARHLGDRADELEVLGPDRADERDHGRRDAAELGDLPEAAHAHLGDEHVGLWLEAEHRQRQADLVVEAAGGVHGGRDGAAERAERVLRRGLARRAHHGDDPGARPRAHERWRAPREPRAGRRARAPPRRGRARRRRGRRRC